jgi:hypothetical protein
MVTGGNLMKLKEKEDGSIKIPKKCPGCGNHCPADKLKCGKGRKIFANYRKKLEEAGQKAAAKTEIKVKDTLRNNVKEDSKEKSKDKQLKDKRKKEERPVKQELKTDLQAAILGMLSDRQPRKPKEIRKAFDLEKKEFIKLLSGMEKNGLVEVKGDKHLVFLAGQSSEEHKKVKKCSHDGLHDKHRDAEHHHDIHYNALTSEEMAVLKKLLKKLMQEPDALNKEEKSVEGKTAELKEAVTEKEPAEKVERPTSEAAEAVEAAEETSEAAEAIVKVEITTETAADIDEIEARIRSEYPEDWQDWI